MSEPGALVAGRYRLRSRIGAGGMGVVWEAWDERLLRPVALKLLHRSAALDRTDADLANRRAMREARITARLQHRYAVSVFDVVEHEGQACLVMPFLPSMTLAAVLREGGPLSVNEAVPVGAQVAAALAAAHQLGIVHRDIKPGNILIIEDGTAMISDFGIAHALGDATLTTTGVVHGTPAYLAPEVARGGDSTYASDVFSLGATLYASIEGDPPFGTDPNSIALLHRVAAGQFQPPQRTGSLTPLIVGALSPDPRDRPSMPAVAHTLELMRSGLQHEPLEGQSWPGQAMPAPIREASTVRRVEPSAAGGQAVPPSVAVRQRTGRPRGGMLAAAVLLLAAGAAVALLLQQGWPAARVAAPPPLTQTSAASDSPGTTTTAAAPTTVHPSASPAPPTTTRSATTPSLRRPTHTPDPTQRTADGTPTAAQLAHAISTYYAMMPDNTEDGWPRMTASYRANHAGGRSGYERFWSAVRRVTADHVRGRPPDRVEATITYYYRSGRVVQERTSYRLVEQHGTLKIDESTVLSSTG